MPLAYWCVLIAALLPYVLGKYAKRGVESDNRYPREDYDNLPPRNRRAYAAHQNALETFPFFAVSVIIALTMGAPVYLVNVLAVLYIVLRIAHALLYIFNQPTARSMVFAVGMAVNVAIFVLPVFR
ncbi:MULTISPECIES: MAPEG family protein [unclassified Afipia]|uniref:MAPEG family protein n=1 Tax=unclassified Afipia TaxID=2642050 RepID=UPI0003FAA6BE|nr:MULTISPECIES: MAPEG family protein [unclassified Afipia]